MILRLVPEKPEWRDLRVGDEVLVFGGRVGADVSHDIWCRITLIEPGFAWATQPADIATQAWLTLEPIDPTDGPGLGRNSWEVKEVRRVNAAFQAPGPEAA